LNKELVWLIMCMKIVMDNTQTVKYAYALKVSDIIDTVVVVDFIMQSLTIKYDKRTILSKYECNLYNNEIFT